MGIVGCEMGFSIVEWDRVGNGVSMVKMGIVGCEMGFSIVEWDRV